jgi:hypothetical protein
VASEGTFVLADLAELKEFGETGRVAGREMAKVAK